MNNWWIQSGRTALLLLTALGLLYWSWYVTIPAIVIRRSLHNQEVQAAAAEMVRQAQQQTNPTGPTGPTPGGKK